MPVTDHDGQVLAHVAPAPRIARRLAAEGISDRGLEVARAVEGQPLAGAGLGGLAERLDQARLQFRANPRHRAQSPVRGGVAQLLGRVDVQAARDLHRALGGEAEVATQPDEVGGQLALELGQLGDLAPSRRAR